MFCVYSMVIDYYKDKWEKLFPDPYAPPYYPPYSPITQEEIDEFRELLKRAREYDKKNSEPDCELESKKKQIKELADKLGVDISFIDGEK